MISLRNQRRKLESIVPRDKQYIDDEFKEMKEIFDKTFVNKQIRKESAN